MILRVDTASAVPPYEQIRGQIATMIASGILPVGRRLPTIRQLAADLGLAGGTVARAYRELEQAGLIRSRGRHGTFVLERRLDPHRERERALVQAASVFAAQAAQAGVDPHLALDRAMEALLAKDGDASRRERYRGHPRPASHPESA
jgi:DNA-binding transcriptional regulator YhcF (GntR family)